MGAFQLPGFVFISLFTNYFYLSWLPHKGGIFNTTYHWGNQDSEMLTILEQAEWADLGLNPVLLDS